MLGSSAKFHEVFSRFLRLEQNRTHLFMSQKTVAIICLIRPTAPEGHCCTQLAVLWSFKESQYKHGSNLFWILILCSYSHINGIILIRHGVDKQSARIYWNYFWKCKWWQKTPRKKWKIFLAMKRKWNPGLLPQTFLMWKVRRFRTVARRQPPFA